MSIRQELRNPSRDQVLQALGIDPVLYEQIASQNMTAPIQPEMGISEAIELFRLKRLRESGWTNRCYSSALKNFAEFMTNRSANGHVTVNHIRATDVTAFTLRPLPSGKARRPSSVNRDIAILSSFCRFLVGEEHLRRNPAEQVDRVPMPQGSPKALTEKEQQRLLDLCRRSRNPVRNFTIVHLTLNTGLRASEISRLRWRDVNLPKGELRVIQGKGGRDRTVPLLPTVVDSLVYYHQFRRRETACPGYEDTLFLNTAGSRWGCAMTVGGLELMLNPLLRKLKKPKGCSFHILRHTCAVNLLWRGVHIAIIGALLGHRSFETTSKYLILGDPAVRDALTAACPEGVLVPAIRREIDRSYLSDLVATVFQEVNT